MGDRTSVKFENERYEQTYKLGADDLLTNVLSIEKWVDAAFLGQVQQVFQQMHLAQMGATSRLFPAESANQFEEII